MPIDIRALGDADFDTVLQGFNEAFSDYAVPFKLAPEQLREMMVRRGYVPRLSAAAFEQGRIVSFVLNARDGARAYNMGTGVVPAFRRRGLSRAVLDFTLPLLRADGARRYMLEVIESNTPAVTLYESAGFRESRRLQCWSFSAPSAATFDETLASFHEWAKWWEVEPSWQNSTAALQRAKDPFVILGDARAYAVVFPSNGDLPQLAVDPAHRRKGLGRTLLSAASTLAQRPLRIINVDEGDSSVSRFLEAAGATRTIRQIEMALTL